MRAGLSAAPALALALGCLTGSAAAATVEAREETSATAPNRVTVNFAAAPGEANETTISATQAEADSPLDVRIVDAGAPLEAKGGCSGGGSPGTPAHCLVHAPKWADGQDCGRDCFLLLPGTEWRVALTVDLGDGANSLNAAALQSPNGPLIDATVMGGPAADQITTGPGNDRIDPGLGDDVVHAGDGWDRVVAAATPDGGDLFDLGSVTGGEVDYSQRSEPLRFEGATGGGAGEQDHLISAVLLVGGSGDDVFSAKEGLDSFEGRGGDDVLTGDANRNLLYGGAGDDHLYGGEGDDRLVGGSGNDTLDGGAGNDALVEFAEGAGFGPEANLGSAEEPGGDDLALGGSGDDWMSLGAGADTGYGEEGDDSIVAGAGTDKVDGGPGNDILAGGADFDEISGGAGGDQIFAGPQIPTSGGKLGFAIFDVPGPDAVDCGPDEDAVAIDGADRVAHCERVELENAIGTGRAIRDRRHGTALLPVHVAGPGKVIVSGPRIRRTARPARLSLSRSAAAMVPIRPRGAARAALLRSGRCQVQVRVLYRRRDGGVFTARRRLELLLPGSRR